MNIKIVYGAAEWNLTDIPEGTCLSTIVKEYAPIYGVPEGASVMINGEAKNLDERVQENQEIVFAKETGTKG